MLENDTISLPQIYTPKIQQSTTFKRTGSSSLPAIGDCVINSGTNSFIKEYIVTKCSSNGIKIPDNVQILISSPENYSKEFKNKLKHISKDIYKARVVDLFNLLEQDAETVQKRVSGMQISESDKNNILELKQDFDNYYKIELKTGDKTIDLLNMSDEDFKELSDESPEFANFIKNEQDNLNMISNKFARKEMSKLRLDAAGRNSAMAAGGLAAILSMLVVKGVWESKELANAIKTDKAKFLKEQAEILEEGLPKLQNPFKEFAAAAKNGLTKSKAKDPKAMVLGALLATTLAGSADDLMGCVKDSIQDIDNFGWNKGLAINIPAALFGILTSAAIAPMIEGQVQYNRAAKYLQKYEGELEKLGIDANLAKNSKSVKNIMEKGGRTALITAGALVLANALKGIVTAASSSGSSWGSMAGTRIVMASGGNELEKKGIITKEENTFKNTSKNMMAYEAYKGKWKGIAQQDPIIGATGGALGLFTHSNPYIQSLCFGLQGCSETLTACYYQVTGAKNRTSDIDKEKEKLIASAKITS